MKWTKINPVDVIDKIAMPTHFSTVKSLLEIEEAVAKLPAKARRQLVQDIPALCLGEFPGVAGMPF